MHCLGDLEGERDERDFLGRPGPRLEGDLDAEREGELDRVEELERERERAEELGRSILLNNLTNSPFFMVEYPERPELLHIVLSSCNVKFL